MGLNKESARRMFPNLTEELESRANKISINSIRTNPTTGERAISKNLTNYMPDVIDFIRRCDTETQAEEIIAFMERRGEIEKDYGKKLRVQLREKGVRSFGTKKEADYYIKHGRL